MKFFVLFVICLLTRPALVFGATLVLKGGIDEKVEITQVRSFAIPEGGLRRLSFRYASPAGFKTTGLTQRITAHRIEYSPEPDSVNTDTDRFGNTFTIVEWSRLRTGASVKESFTAELSIDLSGARSTAPYPLDRASMQPSVSMYLAATENVESADKRIKRLAQRLTQGASNEQAAVMSVLNYVVDNTAYKSPIPEYGAAWTLDRGYGNCQNFSHLSIALLRASGIPARIVGGIALGKKWKVPLSDGALLQSIGQGGHAWIEVWYPDLGWLPYDAQQSHLFVGPRHVKQTVGLDSNDINDSWRASPVLPQYDETIGAEYVKDEVKLALVESINTPKNYIMTSSLAPEAAPARPGAPVEAPPMPTAPAPVPAPAPSMPETVELGNLDFPTLMDFYVKVAGEAGLGRRTLDKETAEYVTGDVTYAQAFTIKRPLRLDTVSLAMHKFGGRLGSLWIDVVRDKDGRPGMQGARSRPLTLDTVGYAPGYKWFDFAFSTPGASDGPVLQPGRYWIILRRSKDAIVSWFYTPGNRTGGVDDTRSTARGIDWSNVLNLDFNYRVRGLRFLLKKRKLGKENRN